MRARERAQAPRTHEPARRFRDAETACRVVEARAFRDLVALGRAAAAFEREVRCVGTGTTLLSTAVRSVTLGAHEHRPQERRRIRGEAHLRHVASAEGLEA